ncbi:PLP-dependent aminotransferase family protein, partial [Pseudomonas aeruginosa]|nr:PLP-dependent aminotransferase family protein [Pseudomonas aeruginosa]
LSSAASDVYKRQQQAWIIEDDYDSEFHYAGRPTACVQGLDAHERTLYIGTFTKSLFPGLRIGYMVLPPALVAPMTVARSLQDGHNASLAQLTLARFIAGGHFGAYVRGMRNLYGERLGFLAERVGKRLGGLVEPRVPAGGLQMPGLLCAGIDETRAIAAAYRAGVELVGLSALHLAAPPRAGFLMGFAAYTTDELEAAVGVLAKTLRGLRANP